MTALWAASRRFREHYPEAEARIGVAEELPYPDDGFDVALSSACITVVLPVGIPAGRGLGCGWAG
jgi:ubiquinone/menaquinone biosynthesis C-methylase UbiE